MQIDTQTRHPSSLAARRVRPAGASAYPDFFVIGAQKCGTTTLYGLLRQHPDVFLPEQKELHYFAADDRPPAFADAAATELNQTTVWQRHAYQALYAATTARFKGEICPTYLYAPQAAARIAKARPDARIIAILRDPVARSFSAYRHMKARGGEPAATFAEALQAEPGHIAQHWQIMAHYTAASLYAPQLQRYYDHFPRDQILILDFEDLKRDPIGTANHVLAFIGAGPLPRGAKIAQTNRTVVLKSGFLGHLLVQKPAWVRRMKKVIPQRLRWRLQSWLMSRLPAEEERLTPEDRARLAPLFHADIVQTRALTGLPFGSWSA